MQQLNTLALKKELGDAVILNLIFKTMFKTRKKRHIYYILDRMQEIHRQINREVLHTQHIDYETVGRLKNLLFKYRRRVILLKA